MNSVLAEIQKELDPRWPISIGWPRAWGDWLANQIGLRLFWSDSIEHLYHPIASIVTSSSHRFLWSQPEWVARFQDALKTIDERGLHLLRNQSTPTGPAQACAAERVQLPVIDLVLPDRKETLNQWLSKRAQEFVHQAKCRISNHSQSTLWISPPLTPPSEEHKRYPLIDQLLAWLPDQLYAIELRKGGKTLALVQKRLGTEDVFAKPSVFVAFVAGAMEHNRLARNLMELGAVGRWINYSPCSSILHDPAVRELLGERSTLAPICSLHQLSQSSTWHWLCHCTRSVLSQPPAQGSTSETELNLLGAGMFERGALGSLIRILSQKRLNATPFLKRGECATVSFSATPLHDLLQRRTFQPHLGRWDWEPFGVCIRRPALERLGARQVLYGDESDYVQLTEQERPFFQMKQSKSGHDWTAEQEWRVLGDCRLNQFRIDEAFIFVPSMAVARQVAPISNWPVVVVNESSTVSAREALE